MHVPVSQEEIAQAHALKRRDRQQQYKDELDEALHLKQRFCERQKQLESEFPYRPAEDFRGPQPKKRGKQKRGPDFRQSAITRRQVYAQDWVWKGFRILVRGRKKPPRWMFNKAFLWELISQYASYAGCRARRLFVLYHFYRSRMYAGDIAEALGCSVESIKSECERLTGRADTMLDRPEYRWLRDDLPPAIYNATGNPCGHEYIPFSRAPKTPEDAAVRDPIACAGEPYDLAVDLWQFGGISKNTPLNADEDTEEETTEDLPCASEAVGEVATACQVTA